MNRNTINLKWLILPLYIFLLILFSMNVSAQTNRKYQMGWEEWEPYQFKTSTRKLTGLDIDLVKAIMGVSKTPVIFKEMPWKRHLEELKAGRVDMAAGASKTKEREIFAYFSDPYRTESAVLYVKKGKGKEWDLKSLSDITPTNFQLCVTRGYYYGDNFDELKKDKRFASHLGEVTNENQCYMMLKRGYVDGFLADPISATASLRKEKMLDDVEIILTIYSDDIHIMFSKQSTSRQFVRTFNKNLAKLKSRGTYFDILGTYLSLKQTSKATAPKKKPPTTTATTATQPQPSQDLSKAAKAFNALRLTRYLKEGREGEEVSHLQTVLKALGFYKGPVDGYFTSDLTAAVRKLQLESNLIPDGIVGPLTYRAIGQRI